MDTEKKQKKGIPVWLWAIIGVLAAALIFMLVHLSSVKNDLKELEAEKELQRQDFQAEVDSLMKVHNELKESYGELSAELAEKDSIIQADAVEIKKLLDSQWDYYRIKKKLDNTAYYWWLRSPGSGNSTIFVIVNSGGRVSYDTAYNTFGVSPCFAI